MKRFLLSSFFAALVIFLYAQEAVYTPTPKAPANGALNQMPNATVSWYAITGSLALKYQFQMDTTNLFNSPLKVDTTQVLLTGYTAHELLFNKVYYWRVRAIDGGQTSAWSQVWNFTVFNKVDLSKPKDKDDGIVPDVNIEWLSTITTQKIPITGITHFDYQIDISADFNSPSLIHGSTTPTVLKTSTSNLLFGQKYYWRVRAGHNKGNTDWCPARYFTVIDKFALKTPVDNATNSFLDVTLKWEEVTGLVTYMYQISKDAAFTQLVEESEISTNSAVATTLMFGTEYFWRVAGRNVKDTSDWSDPFSFTTINSVLLKQPSDQDEGVALKPLLTWTKQTGIVYYELWLDSSPSFSNPILKVQPDFDETQFQVSKLLDPKSVYYWKMRAYSDGGVTADTSGWSPTWSFTTTYGVGIPEKSGSGYSVYPNPARDKVFVNMETVENRAVQFELINVLGSTVKTKTLDFSSGQSVKEVALENISKGVYFIRMKWGENVVNQKIVVEK